MVLGEHGDSQVVSWSQTTVASTPYLHATGAQITESDKASMADQVVKSGIHEILSGKGYTNFGIAACVKRIVKSILYDENAILPITVLAKGEYEIEDVCLSLPCVIGAYGIVNVLQLPLHSEEVSKLKNSAGIIRNILKQLSNNF